MGFYIGTCPTPLHKPKEKDGKLVGKWTYGEYFTNEIVKLFTTSRVSADKKKVKAYTFAEFEDGVRRKKNVKSVSGVSYDYDSGEYTVEEAIETLEKAGYFCILYTTYSHTEEHHKFRIVVPFVEPTGLDGEEYRKVHVSFAQKIGLPETYDKTCADLARFYYLPARKTKDAPHIEKVFDGAYLRPETLELADLPVTANAGSNYTPKEDKELYLDIDGEKVNVKTWWASRNEAPLAEIIATHAEDIVWKKRDNGGYVIQCPFHEEHTNPDKKDEATFVDDPQGEFTQSTITCLHSHCMHRPTYEFVWKLITDGTLDVSMFNADNQAMLDADIEKVVRSSGLNAKVSNFIKKKEEQAEKTTAAPKIGAEESELGPWVKLISEKKATLHKLLAITSQEDLQIFKEENADFAEFPTECLAASGIVVEDAKVIALRKQIRPIDFMLNQLFDTTKQYVDYTSQIETFARVYDVPYESMEDTFVKERKAWAARKLTFETLSAKQVFLHKFEELDRHFIKVGSSLVTSSGTGFAYADTRDMVNTFRIGAVRYSTQAMGEMFSRYTAASNDTGEETSVFEFWANLPLLKSIVHKVVCYPEVVTTKGVYNTYNRQALGPEIEVDLDKFENEELAVFKEILCKNDDAAWEYVKNWVAVTHQKPEKKTPNTILFQGGHGSGKSYLIQKLFVDPHGSLGKVVQNQDNVLGKFNAMLGTAYYFFIDEVNNKLDFKDNGPLKFLISEKTLDYERKGVDSVTINSYHQFMLATNHPDIITLDPGDRRVSYFKTSSDYIGRIEDFWTPFRKKWDSPEMVAKMRYFLRHIPCNKEICVLPFENEERAKLLHAASTVADHFFVTLYMRRGYESSGFEEVFPIYLDLDKPVKIPLNALLNCLMSFVTVRLRKSISYNDVMTSADSFTNLFMGGPLLELADDEGAVELPSCKTMADRLYEVGMITETQKVAMIANEVT
jgi:hypothetical protein